MRTVATLVAGVLASLAAAPAAAQDWHFVDVAADNSSIAYVDRSSITSLAGGLASASVFTVKRVPGRSGVSAMLISLEADCGEPRARMLQVTGFRHDSSRIGQQPGSGRWKELEQGSQAGVIRAFICSAGRMSQVGDAVGADLPFAHARALFVERETEQR